MGLHLDPKKPLWDDCRGHSFLSTNEELLDRYAACPTSTEVIQVQTQYLEQLANVPAKVPDGKALLSLAQLLSEVDCSLTGLTTGHLLENHAVNSCMHYVSVKYGFKRTVQNCDICWLLPCCG